MKKLFPVLCAMLMGCAIMVGCANNQQETQAADGGAEEQPNASVESAEFGSEPEGQSELITPEELQSQIAAGDNIAIVDLRKAADYEAGHIPGAIPADMEAAVNGDIALGQETMKSALLEATGSETGGDREIVLVCYTGQSYAQAGREVLEAMGADMNNVYTLEGGMAAWNAMYPDDITTAPAPVAADASS